MKLSRECMLSMLRWLSVAHSVWNHGHANLENQFQNLSMFKGSAPLSVKPSCMSDMNQRKELFSHLGGEAQIPEIGLKILPSIQNPMSAVDAESMLGSTSTIGQLRETL